MATLEARVQALEERAAELEARLAVPAARPGPRSAPAPTVVPDRPASRAAWRAQAPAPAAPAASAPPPPALEDLLGGRVLAWVGGVAVAIGVLFLLAIAASEGWIGEGARVVMAITASLALLGSGACLHERRGRTDAALAAAAAGVVGLFASLAVAGEVYELVAPLAALTAALVVGAGTTVLAIRWRAPGFGALGICGALVAPLLVGADPSDPRTLVLVAVATASATGVLLAQRWTWLAFGTFALATPQWSWWIAQDGRPVAAVLAVLSGFGLLAMVAAAGFEVRSRVRGLRRSGVVLLALNAFVLALAGYFVLQASGAPGAARGWLVALAAAHLVAGVATRRSTRVSHELALVCVGLGTVLADLALAAFLDGPALAVAWAVTGTGFCAWARRRETGTADLIFAGAGTGAHLALAIAHAALHEAPPELLGAGGAVAPAGLFALAAAAAGCFASARIANGGHPWARASLDAAGLATLAYLTAVTVDGSALVVAWAAEAVALGALARRDQDVVAGWGALAFLGAAAGLAGATLAPLVALVAGLADPVGAAVALAACGAAALILAVRGLGLPDPHVRPALFAGAAVALLHLASTELVTLVELGSPERGQTALSGFWALCGVAALLVGLLRDVRGLRLGALVLLGTTAGKVFLYDLASLTSLYRVASFIALGLLLLCGAFAWQRLRPRDLPDLRDVPDALR